MQPPSSQLTKGSSASGNEGPPAPCQVTNRKGRSTKQPDLQNPSLGGPSLPHRGICPDDEFANLIGAMDNDLDRPEPLSPETLQEQSSQSIPSKGTDTTFNERRNSLWSQRFTVCADIVCSVGIQREAAR